MCNAGFATMNKNTNLAYSSQFSVVTSTLFSLFLSPVILEDSETPKAATYADRDFEFSEFFWQDFSAQSDSFHPREIWGSTLDYPTILVNVWLEIRVLHILFRRNRCERTFPLYPKVAPRPFSQIRIFRKGLNSFRSEVNLKNIGLKPSFPGKRDCFTATQTCLPFHRQNTGWLGLDVFCRIKPWMCTCSDFQNRANPSA